jgi:peroxiredoxin
MSVVGVGASLVHSVSQAPDFTLIDIDGHVFSLSDFRGQIVILDFMATWCPRCIAERPHLQAVQTEFGSRLAIVSISIADTEDAVRVFRDEHNTNWTYARDTLNLIATYNVTGTSTLYLIDQDGYIQYQHHATVVEASVLTSEIHDLLPDSDTTQPTADAGSDQSIVEGTVVAFDGSTSSDNAGITSYTWTFHDTTLQTLRGAQPTYTFTTEGIYMVTLNVTDAVGHWDTDTVTITVQNEGSPDLMNSPYIFPIVGIIIALVIAGLVYTKMR